MQLQILYKFMEDRKFHTCYVSYDQYKNFKKLSIIRECKIIKRNQEKYEKYIDQRIDQEVKCDFYNQIL